MHDARHTEIRVSLHMRIYAVVAMRRHARRRSSVCTFIRMECVRVRKGVHARIGYVCLNCKLYDATIGRG